MLKKILSRDTCAKCRVCCGFTEEDKWEIPLIFSELREKLGEKLGDGVKLVPHGGEYVFDMDFDGEKVVMCPMAGERGCTLGEDKPFDCRVWPFRVNDLAGKRVITISPVCRAVFALPLETLVSFLNEDGFAQTLFDAARLHPDMVKPYMDGYPILAVEKE